MNSTIILDELNFIWERKTMSEVVKMWNAGDDLNEIIHFTGRSEDEVFLLLLHLSRMGRIAKRKNGIFGG